MLKRLDYFSTSPEAMQLLLDQEKYLQYQFSHNDTLEKEIWELVKLRVSMINQCAYCIDMHSKDARHYGVSPERIFGLSTWRDSPLYSDEERSALAWAEVVTSAREIADEDYQKALSVFNERALLDLTLAINAINSWNRVAKAFKPVVGSYQSV